VTATIEGVEHSFVVDTGASFAVVRPNLFAALTADRRGQLSISTATTMGQGMSLVTRARSMSLGGGAVQGLAVAQDSALLDGIAREVGHAVDGLVGSTFLREFLVTIDYPTHQLVLRRYADRRHIVDEFRRVGVFITPSAAGSAHRYAILQVVPGTDAATNPTAAHDLLGAWLLAVDHQPLDDLDPEAADRLLRGEPSSTHVLEVLAPGPGAAVRSLVLRVDELLALP
jgi:hypothetical protein